MTASGPLAWLNTALEEKSMHLYFTPMDPRFHRLHSDPDFHAVLDRAGLRLSPAGES